MKAFIEAYLERIETLHEKMKQALAGLSTEALYWIPGAGMNSLAVLIVHTAASERYWIGDIALQDPAGRNREAEFQARGLDANTLQARLDQALAYARESLGSLTVRDLETVRTSPSSGEPVTVAWALLHALEHLGIHLGHVQLARQLWEQNNNIS